MILSNIERIVKNHNKSTKIRLALTISSV